MNVKYLLSSVAVTSLAAAAYFSYTNVSEEVAQYQPRVGENTEAGLASGQMQYFKQVRANQYTGVVDPADVQAAKQQVALRTGKTSNADLNWEAMGPMNVGGRTRCIMIDENNSDHLLTGGVSGGLFVSNNAGGTWTAVVGMEAANVSYIAQGPNNTVYVATGCSFETTLPYESVFPGTGMYKSTDGGLTFSILSETVPTPNNLGSPWAYINKILVGDDGTVYAATHRGMRVSTDGGATWVAGSGCPTANIEIQDLEWLDNGAMLAVAGGGVYTSATPSDICSFVAKTNGIPGSSSRMDVAVAPSNKDIAYAVRTQGGFLDNVYVTSDAGETWNLLSPAPPTTAVDPSFAPFGSNGQASYDLAVEVYPNNPSMFIMGGVTQYRVAGSWELISINLGVSDGNPFYVHSDIHDYAFDPNNPNTLYICSDGGIGKTTNASDATPTFTTNNRNLNITQFYRMSFGPNGVVMGGTQDNGTQLINPNNAGTSQDAIQVLGGDGFSTAISNKIGSISFATLYYGQTFRIDSTSSRAIASTDNLPNRVGEGNAPFHSRIELWESTNDLTSQDSVNFIVAPVEQVVGSGNGNSATFSGTLSYEAQPASQIVVGTVGFTAGSMELYDDNGDGTVTNNNGDSVGAIDYTDFSFTITFNNPPTVGLPIFGEYQVEYSAGDTVFVYSQTIDTQIEYILQNPAVNGDTIHVQDPIQSLMANASNGAVMLTRDAVRNKADVEWIEVLGPNGLDFFPNGNPNLFGGIATDFEFTEDGNSMFVSSTNGGIYRVDGLNNVYYGMTRLEMVDVTSVRRIASMGNQVITGIKLHPTNNDRLMVTLGNYGNTNYVHELTDAMIDTGFSAKSIRQGDLPAMPTYMAEYNVENPDMVILGTDNGVWVTEDINATPVAWILNESVPQTIVTDVMQQRLPIGQADNHERLYIATYGAGFFTTGDLINSIGTEPGDIVVKDDAKAVKVYPNPVYDNASIEVELSNAGTVAIKVFDLQGRMVKQMQNQYQPAGKSTVNLNMTDFPMGTYIVQLESNGVSQTGKFILVK